MGARSDHSDRSRAERIERLRNRLDRLQLPEGDTAEQLRGVLKGILDLLADEL